jgi:inositol oxygenase
MLLALKNRNTLHRYQSAERARKEFPDDKAMQVAALIHDFGKVLVEFGFPQWTIVGDTYLVGCAFPAHAAVYPDQHARLNPDAAVPELNTPCGIYESKCGTENWLCSYGHDEYLFQVLEGNKDAHSFPRELWNIIRFHSLCACTHIPPPLLLPALTCTHTPPLSCSRRSPAPTSPPSPAPGAHLCCSYPWHTGTGSGGAYTHLMKPEDHILKTRVLKFNEYDLYSKSDDEFRITPELVKYYDSLLDHFFPAALRW